MGNVGDVFQVGAALVLERAGRSACGKVGPFLTYTPSVNNWFGVAALLEYPPGVGSIFAFKALSFH